MGYLFLINAHKKLKFVQMELFWSRITMERAFFLSFDFLTLFRRFSHPPLDISHSTDALMVQINEIFG